MIIVRPWMGNRMLHNFNVMTDLVQRSRQPWPARVQVEDAPDAFPGLIPVYGGFADSRMSGVLRFVYRETSRSLAASLAQIRGARTVVALESYRRDSGSLPDSLKSIVPTYLDTALVDPFSGGSLLYRKTGANYVVYSVGPDGADNGGNVQWPERRRGVRAWPADMGFQVVSAK